jgi:RES domain-containing protein
VPDTPGLGATEDGAQLPADWRDYPAPAWEAQLGDSWVREGALLWLSVPSAIVPEEYNVLINPAHPAMREVRVTSTRPFRFDQRLA